mmetsp:Transcript_85689/g.239462  ORF Transcript_85689/g.239462 Transcript_85689/m.239462 type:complete len:757 (-) Transcript_85689:201-2471(-)
MAWGAVPCQRALVFPGPGALAGVPERPGLQAGGYGHTSPLRRPRASAQVWQQPSPAYVASPGSGACTPFAAGPSCGSSMVLWRNQVGSPRPPARSSSPACQSNASGAPRGRGVQHDATAEILQRTVHGQQKGRQSPQPRAAVDGSAAGLPGSHVKSKQPPRQPPEPQVQRLSTAPTPTLVHRGPLAWPAAVATSAGDLLSPSLPIQGGADAKTLPQQQAKKLWQIASSPSVPATRARSPSLTRAATTSWQQPDWAPAAGPPPPPISAVPAMSTQRVHVHPPRTSGGLGAVARTTLAADGGLTPCAIVHATVVGGSLAMPLVQPLLVGERVAFKQLVAGRDGGRCPQLPAGLRLASWSPSKRDSAIVRMESPISPCRNIAGRPVDNGEQLGDAVGVQKRRHHPQDVPCGVLVQSNSERSSAPAVRHRVRAATIPDSFGQAATGPAPVAQAPAHREAATAATAATVAAPMGTPRAAARQSSPIEGIPVRDHSVDPSLSPARRSMRTRVLPPKEDLPPERGLVAETATMPAYGGTSAEQSRGCLANVGLGTGAAAAAAARVAGATPMAGGASAATIATSAAGATQAVGSGSVAASAVAAVGATQPAGGSNSIAASAAAAVGTMQPNGSTSMAASAAAAIGNAQPAGGGASASSPPRSGSNPRSERAPAAGGSPSSPPRTVAVAFSPPRSGANAGSERAPARGGVERPLRRSQKMSQHDAHGECLRREVGGCRKGRKNPRIWAEGTRSQPMWGVAGARDE